VNIGDEYEDPHNHKKSVLVKRKQTKLLEEGYFYILPKTNTGLVPAIRTELRKQLETHSCTLKCIKAAFFKETDF